MTAARIARALGKAYRYGGWWRCRCPVHQSHGPTLALRDGDRALVVCCHAGCAPAAIHSELRRLNLFDETAHIDRPLPAGAGNDDARRTAMAAQIWEAARDARGSPVERYLANRGITLPPPQSLRWAPRCRHPSVTTCPAMIARIVNVDGELVGVHRTFLKPDGTGKAPLLPQRAALGPVKGGAVRLARAAELLLIGEGIETSLAAMQCCCVPAWATLGTAGLKGLILPPDVRNVIVLADHDANGAGQRAAHAAARRWLAEGRQVRIALPPAPGTDFNDMLIQESANAVA